jgi:hypothetical protein
MTWLMWNLVSVRSEMVLVSEQDRGLVCAKRTIGSEISLDTLDDEDQVEAHFGLFGD